MDGNNGNKEYTTQAKHAIMGEAFFESLVAEHCLPHHVSGLKDVGIDFLCDPTPPGSWSALLPPPLRRRRPFSACADA